MVLLNETDYTLITGGTGFLGSALSKHFVSAGERVISFSRRWDASVALKKELDNPLFDYANGDVTNYDDLRRTVIRFGLPNRIIHAAAYKDVPSGERNMEVMFDTNVTGVRNVVSLCQEFRIPLTFISTDKACNPVNAYGVSKLLGEKLTASLWHEYSIPSVSVRYGNVWMSTGSIGEYWHKLCFTGQSEKVELRITDPEMTRFWLSRNEAVKLVMFAGGSEPARGMTVVPSLWACTIGKLANAFRDLSEKEVKLSIVGARLGEKKHESMVEENESVFNLDCGEAVYFVSGTEYHDFLWEKTSVSSDQPYRQMDRDEVEQMVLCKGKWQ